MATAINLVHLGSGSGANAGQRVPAPAAW